MEIILRDYLKELANEKPIYYIPNEGNAGDSLIACATYQLFAECGVRYVTTYDTKINLEGKTVIYAGGGNLVKYYSSASEWISRLHKRVKKLVLLPHTIQANEDLLSSLSNNVDIFCREKISYEHVRKYAKNANVFLDHDIAFSLDVKGVLQRSRLGAIVQTLHGKGLESGVRRILKCIHNEWVVNRLRFMSGGVANCFRTDQEKTNIEIPADNIDLSDCLAFGVHDKEVVFGTVNLLLRYINAFESIRTNRLHLAIACALLNKPVALYANNYWKVEAVYRYSMEGKYPHVKWMGSNYHL